MNCFVSLGLFFAAYTCGGLPSEWWKMSPGMGSLNRLGGLNGSSCRATDQTLGALQSATTGPSLPCFHQRASGGNTPDESGTSLNSAMAKMVAIEGVFKVICDAMQIMGGVGYTTDYPIERHLRDAKNGFGGGQTR